MVQAAAQAQAVVAAAKTRGDGLVPMNAAQIAALSQIQAQAIVHARKSIGTPQQIQTQIQLQAQALVHAHTQAQISAGIYKGDANSTTSSTTSAIAPARSAKPAPVKRKPAPHRAAVRVAAADTIMTEPASVPNPVLASAATAAPAAIPMETTSAAAISTSIVPQAPAPSSSSPQFLAQLNNSLNKFWKEQLSVVHEYSDQTEQDFKTHNDLPLARIKRIMKSDEDVRMISAEAPVLFAKACELFILDLSIRSWNYSQLHKRRTLQKEDIREAIQKTDIFDFLVDVI
jgi:nuclear transcription factor Y gamma